MRIKDIGDGNKLKLEMLLSQFTIVCRNIAERESDLKLMNLQKSSIEESIMTIVEVSQT